MGPLMLAEITVKLILKKTHTHHCTRVIVVSNERSVTEAKDS